MPNINRAGGWQGMIFTVHSVHIAIKFSHAWPRVKRAGAKDKESLFKVFHP